MLLIAQGKIGKIVTEIESAEKSFQLQAQHA